MIRAFVLLFLVGMTTMTHAESTRFAFGVNGEDFSISTYRVDEEGRLRHLGHRPIDKAPSRVVLDPTGKFILAVSNTTDRLMVFRLNPVTAELRPVPGSPFATGGRSPFSIRFHPSGHFIYLGVRFGGVGAMTFNQETGAVKPIPGSPFPAQRRTREVSIHPSGKYLYAINGYSNSVSAYTINQKTGQLSEMSGSPYSVGDFGEIDYLSLQMGEVPLGAGGLPISIDMDPEGRFIFIANKAGASVSVFAVNSDNGNLKSVKGSPFFTGFNPYRLKVHPSGHFLFVSLWSTGQVAVHEIENKTGILREIKGSPFSIESETPVDITFNTDGSQVYVSNYDGNDISLLDVDIETGALRLKDIVTTRLGPWSLQLVDGKETTVPQETELYSVSMTSGAQKLELVNDNARFVNINGRDAKASVVTVSPNGRFLYVVNNDKSLLSTYAINPDTGVMTEVSGGKVKSGDSITDMTIDINGWYLYAADASGNNMSVFFLDPETGVPREVRGSPFHAGAAPVSVVLDPAQRFSFVVNRESSNVSVFRHLNNVTPLIFEARKYGSPFAAGKDPVAIAIDPTGRFAYVANQGSNTISAFDIHRKTGALSALTGSPFSSAGQRPVALVVHPDGRFLYVANESSNDIRIFHIDAMSGALEPTRHLVKLGVQPKALWLNGMGDGLIVLASDGKQILNYKINRENGSLALITQKKAKSPIDDLYVVGRK